MSLSVAVVDDQRINRVGTAAVLAELDDVAVTATFDFETARQPVDWGSFDWVVIDVAQEGAELDEVPSAGVIERIRHTAGPDRPVVIAVTSNPIAFDEDVVRRRLLEAGADFFVWRADLDRMLSDTSAITTLDARADTLPPTGAPDDIPELGVTGESSVNAFVEAANSQPGLRRFLVRDPAGDGRRTRWLTAARRNVSEAGQLAATTAEGNRPRQGEQDIPGIPQLRHLFLRATRVSSRHRD